MKTRDYFNTTSIHDPRERVEKAESQKNTVLDLFKQRNIMTASQVWDYFPENTPITSIRRAMSVLAKKGTLIKTSNMQEGIYGAPEHFYKLRENIQFVIFN